MCELLVFGGTTEGRKLAEFCIKNRMSLFVSVVTDYGESLLEKSEFLHILKGRITDEEMENFIVSKHIGTVVDATHPYATEATRNILSACKKTGVRYIRVKRDSSEFCEWGKYFNNIDALIDYLNTTKGNIFITTGSKKLNHFCMVKGFSDRCIVRVLPTEGAVAECMRLGFSEHRIIAKKGPFSEEQNIFQLKSFNAKFLVTKESGSAGGFENKAKAALKCDAELLIIKRPDDSGLKLHEVENLLLAEKSDG